MGLGAGRDWLLHPHARNMATHKAPFYWINSRLRTGIQRWLSPAVFPCLAPLSASLPWLFLAGGSGTCTAEIGGGKTWGWGGRWGCQQTQAGKCVLKTAHKAGDVSEEAELRRLGWSIFFRACTRESRCTGSSVGGSLLPVALVSPLHSHHQKVSAF